MSAAVCPCGAAATHVLVWSWQKTETPACGPCASVAELNWGKAKRKQQRSVVAIRAGAPAVAAATDDRCDYCAKGDRAHRIVTRSVGHGYRATETNKALALVAAAFGVTGDVEGWACDRCAGQAVRTKAAVEVDGRAATTPLAPPPPPGPAPTPETVADLFSLI